MRQLSINLSMVFFLFFALTSHTVDWNAKLVGYAVAANKTRKNFCKKDQSVRSNSGAICDQSEQIAAYILLACSFDKNGKDNNTFGFITNEKQKPSKCYSKASKKIEQMIQGQKEYKEYMDEGTQKGSPNRYYDEIKHLAGDFVGKQKKDSDRIMLCSLLPMEPPSCNPKKSTPAKGVN